MTDESNMLRPAGSTRALVCGIDKMIIALKVEGTCSHFICLIRNFYPGRLVVKTGPSSDEGLGGVVEIDILYSAGRLLLSFLRVGRCCLHSCAWLTRPSRLLPLDFREP